MLNSPFLNPGGGYATRFGGKLLQVTPFSSATSETDADFITYLWQIPVQSTGKLIPLITPTISLSTASPQKAIAF